MIFDAKDTLPSDSNPTTPHRDLRFHFSALDGIFDVVAFQGLERVSAPFEVRLELSSFDPSIPIEALVDTEAYVEIQANCYEPKYIHGVITEVARGDAGNHRTFYTLTLRPALARLSHVTDSKIWQFQTVQDVIKSVLLTHDIHHFEWRIFHEHPKRDYITQFAETTLAFIERLLSEEGISYHFEHAKGHHLLVFTDNSFTSPYMHPFATLEYNATSGGYDQRFFIDRFHQYQRLTTTGFALSDYTHKNPRLRMDAAFGHMQSNERLNSPAYPMYDYPGGYSDAVDARTWYSQCRLEAVQVDSDTGRGRSNCYYFTPGNLVQISHHPSEAANVPHFVTQISYEATQTAALEEEAGHDATDYSVEFMTIPASKPFRPRLHSKPTCDGPMIATVTGPEGEEIYTDEMGRCKVHFQWDRHNAPDENASCWLRVAQGWAGAGWGHMAIPRIGQEVLVSFIDGDIDRPIVTGSVYNADHLPPYPLPEHKTKMVIRSDTHKGKGYNELSFEDTPGSEQIYLRAEKSIVQMYGSENLSIHTNGDLGDGIADAVEAQAMLTGFQFFFGNLIPGSMQTTGLLTAQLLRVQSELSKRRR